MAVILKIERKRGIGKMVNPWKLKKQLINTEICRNCFNNKYRINLQKEDFLYSYYESKCCECNELKHTVKGFTAKGTIKIMFCKRVSV